MEDADELVEEFEHLDFMATLNYLAEQIFMSLLFTNDVSRVKREYDDIIVFGNEPVFASILFDKLLKEANESR